ncbi:bifunctional (p)ppGpp synthetase/guanosine-3',5'-bis(diphosphate) 3'-pyrophosphohydrolase, partial [Lujinxingia vulgaris]
REKYLNPVVEEIDADLRDLRIRGKVVGRPKQLYSVYQKMVIRGREFDDIYDLIGIRVIVGSVRDCYAVLGAIHARWTPLPGRFKDYIATPKFNLYQSLHTTVIGPSGRTVEIQIRTHEMHQQAEYGVAAHWMYKERMNGGGKTEVRASDTDMAWLAHISDWQAETAD